MKGIKQVFKKIFSLDRRSLALFRVGLGLILIGDITTRMGDITAHYTDIGVMPRSVAISEYLAPAAWSLHFANGTFWFQLSLCILALLVYLFLLIGFYSRLSTVLSWILLLSIQFRNPLVLQGGDDLLRLLVFWGMFLPLGSRYSIDYVLSERSSLSNQNKLFSMATIGLILQVCFVYWFTFVFKWHPHWFGGEAMFYALSLDQFSTSIGEFLLQLPEYMAGLTYFVLFAESVGPMLFFVPFYNGFFRILGIVLIGLLQIGIYMCMHLGLFPFISILAVLVLIPGVFWEHLGYELFGDVERTIVTSEEDWNPFYLSLLVTAFFLPVTVETKTRSDQLDADEKINDWTFYRDLFVSSRVFAFMGSLSRRIQEILFTVLTLPPLLFDYLPEFSSSSSSESQPLSSRSPYRIGLWWFVQSFLAGLLIYIFLWNVNHFRTVRMGPWEFSDFRGLGVALHVDQRWNMFAPYPILDDGWYVIEGNLENGKSTDLFAAGGPVPIGQFKTVTWDKPENVSATYKNQRWRKYMMNLWKNDLKEYRLHYGKYLCRRWNAHYEGGRKLHTFRIYFMLENTIVNMSEERVDKTLIWKHYCYDKPDDW